MKITDIKIEVVRRSVPGTGLQSDLGRFGGGADQGILRIITDEGVEGNCQVGEFRTGGKALFEQIIGVLKPELLGRDPADREWLWNRLRILQSRRSLVLPAWAPVDVALWDIAGKSAGVPIVKLLGVNRRSVGVYATYPPRHDSPEGYVGEAEQLRDQGFRAYKIHPGVMETRMVIDMVERVRTTLGPEFTLMLDPNNGYDYQGALQIGRALDSLGFYWFEDPVPWNDFDAIVELSRRLDTPLCMSDPAEFRFREAAHFVRLQAVRMVRGTARKIGITGLKKLCGLAEGFGLNCEIGTAGNSSLDIANLHVMLSVSNCSYFEWWLPKEARQFGMVEDLGLNKQGVLDMPDRPGLGFEIDWPWVEKHRIATLT